MTTSLPPNTSPSATGPGKDVPPGGPPDVVAALREAGCVFAEDEARMLVAAARTPQQLTAMVRQRRAGQPLEHVVGFAEFCGRRVAVGQGVFVPRRRTEFLVRQAVARARASGFPRHGSRTVAVDLCCGSGALGVALAAELGGVELYAADIDAAAVRCARRNLAAVDGQVFEGDLFDALPGTLRGRVDVLLANVPYVPTADVRLLPAEARLHEPLVALDGGDDGLHVLRRVAHQARGWLADGGHLLFETSARQARHAADLVAGCGLRTELAGSDRYDATVVVATNVG